GRIPDRYARVCRKSISRPGAHTVCKALWNTRRRAVGAAEGCRGRFSSGRRKRGPMIRPLGEMRLVVVSHVVHYRFEGRLFAYGPYAREILLWAELFGEIAIASPCREERPPADCLAFDTDNISIMPQKEAGGETLRAKLALLLALPAMI